jgi:hypothetical protein
MVCRSPFPSKSRPIGRQSAFAVVELLDDLRDRIWAHYSAQLLDQYREQYGPADSHHTDDATGNPSP